MNIRNNALPSTLLHYRVVDVSFLKNVLPCLDREDLRLNLVLYLLIDLGVVVEILLSLERHFRRNGSIVTLEGLRAVFTGNDSLFLELDLRVVIDDLHHGLSVVDFSLVE